MVALIRNTLNYIESMVVTKCDTMDSLLILGFTLIATMEKVYERIQTHQLEHIRERVGQANIRSGI